MPIIQAPRRFCGARTKKKIWSKINHLVFRTLLFRGRPAARRISRSPSASQRLALTSWTIFIHCFPNMMGKLTPAITQGQKESILFARASSSAPALYGLAKSDAIETCEGLPGCIDAALALSGVVWRSEGERSGEEKERR